MSKDKYIKQLLQLFRQYGYEGATLSKISQGIGLGKASLYHHFPGGKEEMMDAVLDYLAEGLERDILTPLKSSEAVLTRLEKMCQAFNRLYEEGKQPCIFAVLLLSSARDIFQEKVRKLFVLWIEEMAKVLMEEGFEPSEARERSQDAAIAIQGALIVVQGIGDQTPFERTLKRLPQQMLSSDLASFPKATDEEECRI